MRLPKIVMYVALLPITIRLLFRQKLPFSNAAAEQHFLKFCLAKTGLPDPGIVGKKPKFTL